MIEQNTKIQFLKGVGEKRAALLSKLGIDTVGDLLRYYPRDYRDWSKTVPISQAIIGDECCIRAVCDKTPRGVMIKKGLTVFKTSATDGNNKIAITIFNNKYAAQSLEQGEEYLFYGKISGNLYSKEMVSPLILKDDGRSDIIHPIYPLTQGINSKYIEKLIKSALALCPDCFEDPIPLSLREKLCLMEINQAIKQIHFPDSEDYLAEARRRLVFEELFVLQTGLMKMKGIAKNKSEIIVDPSPVSEFMNSLPFKPTGAQSRAVSECLNQMNSGFVMNRLLQGDVGSGKTLVAAAVIYAAVKSGYQTAFMAPTEILASQHFKTLTSFFKNSDIKTELLTGSMTKKNKSEIKQRVLNGETDVLIGTHSLIQSDVEFKNIGLVITDEQHRFGVRQRNALSEKGQTPHTLVMSATPIPRTLALIIYGDLDLSVLDEMPPGRQVTETYCIDSNKRKRAFNYIKKHLDSGFQGYIVCPLIEESETGADLVAAEDYAEDLCKNEFKDYNVGLLHGKMKPSEKENVMSRFASGEIQLLVSTTVIEVGVDVPNAVIMVIENAERFGLSQLHQLRGRIGRGSEKSTCILITDSSGEATKKRMKIMTQTTDGFRIADEDLKLRGPGDFFGSRQHGLPDLKIAMLTDTFTIKESGKYASEIIRTDYNLALPEHQALKRSVDALFNKNILMN